MHFTCASFLVAAACMIANARALPRPAPTPAPAPAPGSPYSVVNVNGGNGGNGGNAPGGPPATVTQTVTSWMTTTMMMTISQNGDNVVTITPTVDQLSAAATSVITTNADDTQATVTTVVLNGTPTVLTKPTDAPTGVGPLNGNGVVTKTVGHGKHTKTVDAGAVITETVQDSAPTAPMYDNGMWHTTYPSGRTTEVIAAKATTIVYR